MVTLKETYGAFPSAELDLIMDGDKVRLRVREPHGKATIFLTRDDLTWLAEQALLLEAELAVK